MFCFLCRHIMTVFLWLFVSSTKAIVLATAIAAAITVIIFLVPNFTITTNAQQQQQQQLPTTSQPPPPSAVTQSSSPMLLNKKDSFRVQLPEGWVIQDINNTGFTLAAEVLQGYGLLAELCPQQEEQSIISSNVSSTSTSSNRYIGSCQHAREEVIHIIRYPNLGARLGISSDEDVFNIINNRDTLLNAVLEYQIQKLQDVGYRDINIVNIIDTTINVDNSTTDLSNNRIMATRTTTTIPAKLVEMTYSTNFAPNGIRSGYFILTATAATPRNLGVMTGYSIFYEGNSTANATAEEATTMSTGSTEASPTSTSLASLPSSPPVKQVFDSFELIAAHTEPLTVEITSEDTEGIAPATFEFEASVAGGMQPYTISWDYGDDGISGEGGGEEEEENDEDIEHTFDIAGMYNVRVSVTDSTGRTASDSILIIVDEPPPLTAVNIIPNGTEGIAPATFEFEAVVTGGIEPYTYRWNFGDDSRETGDDETIEHTFEEAGTYNVNLIVIDSTGQVASDNIPIIVEPPSAPPLTAVNIIPNGTEGIAPATFEFEAVVTGGTGPYTYSWEFGDGSGRSRESNAQTVSHTFDQAGRYNVGLVVMDSLNQIAFDSIAITVEEGESPTIEEEEQQPNLDEVDDNNSGSDTFFDLDDSLERRELQNNGITVGGTSA